MSMQRHVLPATIRASKWQPKGRQNLTKEMYNYCMKVLWMRLEGGHAVFSKFVVLLLTYQECKFINIFYNIFYKM